MNIAFLYIAEAYQCYHAAAIALALAEHPGVRVVNYYNEPETAVHLARVEATYGSPGLERRRLRRCVLTRGMQSVRRLGMFKELVLRDNVAELDGYDAIVAVEDTASALRSLGLRRPKMIYVPHGFGDRARGFHESVRRFDLVLPAGPKTAERMLAAGLVRPGGYALIGPVKLETGERLRRSGGALFAQARPVVLYNAHKASGLSSWPRFIEPMLAQFAPQHDFNLIVAPHVKMFRRRTDAVRRRWAARSGPNVLVDPGSARSVDLSYTREAAIYVGDVSSQIYEFLAEPRPCVFLNARRRHWQGDADFAHWQLGDVVEEPAGLMAAISAARSRHFLYRTRQQEMASASLGDRSPGISARAADAILAFCRTDVLRAGASQA